MGANGLQKVEDLDGEEGISPNNINPGMKESSELGPVNSVENVSKRNMMYIMRVIYNSTRSKTLVVNMRVIYIRQNLAKVRR